MRCDVDSCVGQRGECSVESGLQETLEALRTDVNQIITDLEHLQTASTCRQAQLDRQTTEQSRFKASLQRHQQLHTQLQEQILNLSRAHEVEVQRQLNQL